MFEFLFLSFLFLITRVHIAGFSHFDRPGRRQVFFVNEDQDIEIHINGFYSGLSGTSLLFFEPHIELLNVEYRKGLQVVDQFSLVLQNSQNMVLRTADDVKESLVIDFPEFHNQESLNEHSRST